MLLADGLTRNDLNREWPHSFCCYTFQTVLFCIRWGDYGSFGLNIVRESRKKFGFLEKHKDYVERAKVYHTKEETLRVNLWWLCCLFLEFLIYLQSGNSTSTYGICRPSLFSSVFSLNRDWRKKQDFETQMSFTSRWSTHELLVESIKLSNIPLT